MQTSQWKCELVRLTELNNQIENAMKLLTIKRAQNLESIHGQTAAESLLNKAKSRRENLNTVFFGKMRFDMMGNSDTQTKCTY